MGVRCSAIFQPIVDSGIYGIPDFIDVLDRSYFIITFSQFYTMISADVKFE